MKRNILLLLMLQMFTVNVNAQNNPTNLYLDIAKSISTARGNIDLYFTEGSWTKSINSKKVIVSFAENQKANLKFSYSGGQLQDGSRIAFSPGIHIWVKVPSGGLSLRLDTIWFDDNGKYKDWRVKYDNVGTNDPNQVSSIEDALRLNDKSENLFTSKLLKNFTDAKKSDPNGVVVPNTKPILTSIIIKKPNEAEAGLAVSFINNSVIHFSSKISAGTFDNKVSLSSGNFEIRYLEYNVLNKKVECEISQFDINIQNGSFQTFDMLLNTEPGSKLKFNRLKILHDDNNSEITADNGTLNVQVGSGTKISLHNTSKYPSQLVFENGEMNIFDFSYQCTDENKTVFKIGGGSSLKVSTRSGSLAMCDNNGYLSFTNGRLESKLSGIWNSQLPNPDSHFDISLLQVTLDGGYFPFAGENSLVIKSGFVKSESLRFDGLNFSSAVGEIKDLNLVLKDDTKFSLPGGFQFAVKENGIVDGAEPNHPLKFDTKNKYVSGLFTLNFQYSVFRNATNEIIKLHDGRAKMKLEVLDFDTIKGKNIFINGTSTLSTPNTSFNLAFEFSNEEEPNGTLLYIRGLDPIFESTVNFTLTQNNELKVTIPYDRPSENPETRFFSTTIYASLSEPIKTPKQLVKMEGNSVTLDEIKFSPHFLVRIPFGNGEHQDANSDNSSDGNHGNNWSKDCPEIFTVMPACKYHVYLYPKTHGLSSQMSFSIKDKVIAFSFNEVKFDNHFVEDKNSDDDHKDLSKDWRHDGCDKLPIIGGLTGIFISTILKPIPVVGEISAIVLPIIGYAQGVRLEDLAEATVSAKLTESVTVINVSKKWRLQ